MDATTPPRTAEPAAHHHDAPKALSRSQRRALLELGLPTFALALSITVISTYLPTVARSFSGSNLVIGVIIGGEGLLAVLLPVVIGAWSDRLDTRWGGRLPFVVVGTPVAVVGLVGAAFVGNVAALAAAVGVFFVGYFIAYEPYRAMYPDLVPDEAAGRGQSTQAVWRGAGTGLALLAGGLLLAIGQAAPFLAAAGIVVLSIGLFVRLAARRVRHEPRAGHSAEPVRAAEAMRAVVRTLREDDAMRAFFVANALWELALGALKTFVVLWLTEGLGKSLSSSSLMVGAVAFLVLVGAAVSGSLADRIGKRRVMAVAIWCFGAPMALIAATTSTLPLVVAAIPMAIGGGVLLSLPFALLQPLMDEGNHGQLSGFYSASRGVGVMLGPLLAGAAVSLGSSVVFTSTQGYAATWVVCGVATLASLPFLRRVRS